MYVNGSEEFNKAIDDTVNTALHHRLVFTDDNSVIESISKLNGYISSNNTSELQIGTTNMSYVEVEAYTDKILTGREFRLESGAKLEDGTYEYAPIGYFTVQKPDGDLDIQTFKAFDRMQKLERPYSSSLTEPTTTDKILVEICEICRVTLATLIPTPIEVAKIPQGYTCREVLGYIAGLHAKFACFDRFGELNLRWYSETPIEKKIGLIWSFTRSQENFTVEKIEIAKDGEIKYTSGSGFKTVFHSNPLATQEITNSIMTTLNGFTYNASSIEMLDDIRLDPWDVIKVEYLDGNTYLVPCMAITQNFSDGSTVVQAYAKSDTENEYRFTGPTIQYLNRMAMELLVANRVIATKVDADYVQSHAITTDNLDAITANITNLVVDEIDGKYADIHLANIDILDVGQFFADSGLVKNMTIVNGKVTGVLDSVTINANSITSGTLTTDRLVIRGTDKSIVYELNNIDGALQAKDVDTLNGEIITPRTINADRIIAQSITANELATESITSDKIKAGAITAEKLAVDAIMSNNYVADATGSFLNLEDGSFDSKYLKWDEYGKATITDLKVLNSLDFGSGVYPDYIGRPTQWYMRANKYTGGYMSDIVHIGFETWDSLDNPTSVIDDTVVMSVYGGVQYGVEFPITVHAKNLGVYNLMPYEERDRETGVILSRSGSIGTNTGRFPTAYIGTITTDSLNVDGLGGYGEGNIYANGLIRAKTELISKGTLTVEKESYLQGNTTVSGQLIAKQGMYVHDTGFNNWGTAGYIVLARIEVLDGNLTNSGYDIGVVGIYGYKGEIKIRFTNTANITDTEVEEFSKTGSLPEIYYTFTKGTNSVTVDIIVYKQEYQMFRITHLNYTNLIWQKTIITYPNTYESTLRAGAVQATMGTDYFGNVYANGDVIAGYGTANQCSLLGLFKGSGYLNDANDIKHTGFYITHSSSKNVIYTNGFLLSFEANGGNCVVQFNFSYDTSNARYIRSYWWGNWFNWAEF